MKIKIETFHPFIQQKFETQMRSVSTYFEINTLHKGIFKAFWETTVHWSYNTDKEDIICIRYLLLWFTKSLPEISISQHV